MDHKTVVVVSGRTWDFDALRVPRLFGQYTTGYSHGRARSYPNPYQTYRQDWTVFQPLRAICRITGRTSADWIPLPLPSRDYFSFQAVTTGIDPMSPTPNKQSGRAGNCTTQQFLTITEFSKSEPGEPVIQSGIQDLNL